MDQKAAFQKFYVLLLIITYIKLLSSVLFQCLTWVMKMLKKKKCIVVSLLLSINTKYQFLLLTVFAKFGCYW